MTNEEIELLGRIHGMTVAQDAIGFARALLSRAIPEGHVVVPKELTEEMRSSGYESYRSTLNNPKWVELMFKAMIAAAPENKEG